jgi:hypothetical protein
MPSQITLPALISRAKDVEGPVGRLLRCVRASAAHTRAGLFALLTGVSPDGATLPPSAWHFLLHVLHALRGLLAGEWVRQGS